MNWDEVDDATVRKLFVEDELSYRKIAEKFIDATVGKVASRCRRLRLVRGTSRTLGHRKVDGEMRRVSASGRKEPKEPGTMQLMDLDARACRYPFGDVREKNFGFCGMTQEEGSPYCSDHKKLCHQKGYKT